MPISTSHMKSVAEASLTWEQSEAGQIARIDDSGEFCNSELMS